LLAVLALAMCFCDGGEAGRASSSRLQQRKKSQQPCSLFSPRMLVWSHRRGMHRCLRLRGGGQLADQASKHDNKRLRLPSMASLPQSSPRVEATAYSSDEVDDFSETATEEIVQELIETKTATKARGRDTLGVAATVNSGARGSGGQPPADKSRTLVDRTEMMAALEKEFGIQKFRAGQEETISRVLAGNNTLFLSATGSGKSLTYLLPTYLWQIQGRGGGAEEGGGGGGRGGGGGD